MSYLFDPHELHSLVQGVVGKPLGDMIDEIGVELTNRYPGHIVQDPEWIFNNAGGAMGQLLVLHASLTEYIIIFGTNTGTEGASGRFPADDFFIMLEGEHWCSLEGDLERRVTKVGEMAILRRGQAKQYRLPDRAFGLEYARGNIPLMLPFGLADTFTSTLDFGAVWRTMKVYGRATLGNIARGKL